MRFQQYGEQVRRCVLEARAIILCFYIELIPSINEEPPKGASKYLEKVP